MHAIKKRINLKPGGAARILFPSGPRNIGKLIFMVKFINAFPLCIVYAESVQCVANLPGKPRVNYILKELVSDISEMSKKYCS